MLCHSPKGVILTLLAIALATFGSSQAANAGSIIMFSSSGNANSWSTLASGTSDQTNGGGGLIYNSTNAGGISGLTVTTILTSNFPGVAVAANEQSASVRIVNNTAGTLTFYLGYGVDGFSQPRSAPVLKTSMSGTFTDGNNGSEATITSWVNPVSVNASNPNNNWMSGPQAGPVAATGAWAATQVGTLANPFSLFQEVAVTVTAGEIITLSGDTVLSPEPTTNILVCIGLVGMAGYGWSRRRQVYGQPAAAVS